MQGQQVAQPAQSHQPDVQQALLALKKAVEKGQAAGLYKIEESVEIYYAFNLLSGKVSENQLNLQKLEQTIKNGHGKIQTPETPVVNDEEKTKLAVVKPESIEDQNKVQDPGQELDQTGNPLDLLNKGINEAPTETK